ncbi:unnamed protein product [Adineta steineri]|uniref:Uncharacterized protein n=1 Tax=Adineta steineri TaxID=433720 RepID=A0A813NWW7_9BILA|nr:unnamed protein product [Adineta steineri]
MSKSGKILCYYKKDKCTLLNILNEKHFTLSNSDNQQQNDLNKSQSNSLPENSLEISLYRKDGDKSKLIEGTADDEINEEH